MRLLSFILAEKEYGVAIEQVREVRRIKFVTPIPQALHFIEGVVSLRGKVTPIISLRKKLGLPAAKDAAFKRVLIIQTGDHVLGLVVDDIVGVMNLDSGKIEEPDEILNKAEYLVGVGKADKRLILIVDIEKLISGEERGGLDALHRKVELRKKA